MIIWKTSFKANNWTSNRSYCRLPETNYTINHEDMDESHHEIIEYLNKKISCSYDAG